jgi:hypothetical protein
MTRACANTPPCQEAVKRLREEAVAQDEEVISSDNFVCCN